MAPETARQVVLLITAGGAVIWLAGLLFLLAAARGRRTGAGDGAEDLGITGAPPDGWFSGSAEVDGQASALASRAAAVLASGDRSGFGPVKILEKANDRVRFERAGWRGRRPARQWFRQGEFRFTVLGPARTRVEWAVEPRNQVGLLWAGGAFQVAGLVALVGGGWAAYTFLASSPHPVARGQTLQMLQAVHFLWPPFLFGALYRWGNSAVAGQFDAFAHNLPYLDG